MTKAGHLKDRVTFTRRQSASDGFGGTVPGDGWAAISGLSRVSAGFRPEFGREQVAAGRMTAMLRGTITVRRSAASAGVTEADRLTFDTGPSTGKVCAIRSIVPGRRFIEMTIESGV